MLNKIGILNNNNLRTIKTFKNIINAINLNIDTNDDENLYKLKMIFCLLELIYNNRYKKADLLEKKLNKQDIAFILNFTQSNERNLEKDKYKEEIKKEVSKYNEIDCFCEYFSDDSIFCLTSIEEFKRITSEYYNIIKVGLFENLCKIKINFLTKGKTQFQSLRQIAFYSSMSHETARQYLNDIKIAIDKKEISKVSILNNYVLGVTYNYEKYYKNNTELLRKVEEIEKVLIPSAAEEIVVDKVYSVEIGNIKLFCENKEIITKIDNITKKLIEEIKTKITDYYIRYEFKNIKNVRAVFDNIDNLNTILGCRIEYKMSDALLKHIFKYICDLLKKNIDVQIWSDTFTIFVKLKKYDDKIIEEMKNEIVKSEEPLKERLIIILKKIQEN